MEQNQDPRWLRLRPSRIHLVLALSAGFAAVLVVALLPLPGWLRVAMVFSVLLLILGEVRRARLLGTRTVRAFYLVDADPLPGAEAQARTGGLGIRTMAQGSPEQEGSILSGAYVSPWFSSLPYCLASDPPWRRRWPRTIALWPDSLEAEEFRRLRVRLKWH